MKKVFAVFVGLLAIALIGLTVFTLPQSIAAEKALLQTSTAVQVPVEVNDLIGVGIAALMTAGLLFIFNKTGLDLRSYALPISITISTYVVAELQHVIDTIPAAYDVWVSLFFKILVVVLGTVGTVALAIVKDPPKK